MTRKPTRAQQSAVDAAAARLGCEPTIAKWIKPSRKGARGYWWARFVVPVTPDWLKGRVGSDPAWVEPRWNGVDGLAGTAGVCLRPDTRITVLVTDPTAGIDSGAIFNGAEAP